MNNSTALATRLKEVFINGTWVANTNYNALLQNITLHKALYKVGSCNTIAMLTYHIYYYLQGLNNVMENGELTISDKYSFTMPEITSEVQWQKLKADLQQHAITFATHVEKLTNPQLLLPFVKEQYGTYLRNIECIIEHSYYHLGQISLLIKMLPK